MRNLILYTEEEAVEALKKVGTDPYGIEAMAPKMRHLNILLRGLECRVANIIKQEMLSIGGDVAVARGSVDCSIDRTDAIVMGTVKQLERFAEKIAKQPFGLNGISKALGKLIENVRKDVFTLRTPRREISLGKRTLIMGIVNVTPDSFSDGGRFAAAEDAVRHGVRLAEEGADIIDIGGESSRPGAAAVSAEEELRRVIPVIEGLSAKIGVPISVDTTKAAVAKAALEAGAEMINDISAMRFDGEMAGTAARCGASVILMHMRGTPRDMQKGDLAYVDLFAEVIDYLNAGINLAESSGVDPGKIIIDPGIGFGKTVDDNIRLLRGLREFRVLGKPILVGTSRKSFIGRITDSEIGQRLEGTASTVAAAVLNGAHIVRVHDVGFMKSVATMADAIAGR